MYVNISFVESLYSMWIVESQMG